MYSFSYLEPAHCSISSSNCCFLTCIQISQEAGKVVWYSHLFKNVPQFVVIHTVEVLAHSQYNRNRLFFWNSLAFSMIQWMLAIWSLVLLPFLNPAWTSWNFMVHVLLKPGLENFKHLFASVGDECNWAVVWAFFDIACLWDWNETDFFQSCSHCWNFQICWHIECNTFTALSFRIWNSSTGISSPPLALFVVMLSKAHFTSYSRISGSRWVITPVWLSGH